MTEYIVNTLVFLFILDVNYLPSPKLTENEAHGMAR